MNKQGEKRKRSADAAEVAAAAAAGAKAAIAFHREGHSPPVVAPPSGDGLATPPSCRNPFNLLPPVTPSTAATAGRLIAASAVGPS